MSTALLHRLAFGVWAIEPRQAQAYYGLVANLLNGTPNTIGTKRELKATVLRCAHDMEDDVLEEVAPDQPQQQGDVLVISLNDVILKRGDECTYGMEDVAAQLQAANSNPNIAGVVLSIDSPGGEGSAMFLLADVLARMTKPVVAHVNHGTAASCAYGIAASCTEVYASGPQDMFGSTGTYVTLVDMAAYMRAKGIPVHEVYATLSTDKNAPAREALKATGTDPDDEQYQRLRAEYIDPFNEAFLAMLQKKRPQMAATKKEWQGGKLFYADEALSNGLIDGYTTLSGAVARVKALAANNPEARGPKPAAPNALATRHSPLTTQAPTMKFQDIWAKALTALGFTETKTQATAEELTAANADLKAMGLQLVTEAQATELAGLEALKAEAAKATTLAAELSTAKAEAKATRETLAASLKAVGVEMEATADPLAKATETLKDWAPNTSATHTGAKKKEDKKTEPNMELAGHADMVEQANNLPGSKN